jgi:peptidyl-prolyl cis-trans isomerase D
LSGGGGNDTFLIGAEAGADTINGGSGSDRISAAVPALAAPVAEQFRQRMAGDHTNAVGEAAISAAAARSKAEYDEPLARTALGLPAEAPAAPATPATPPAR